MATPALKGADPQRRVRMIIGALFAFIPAWLMAMEAADPIVHVLEPWYHDVKAHRLTNASPGGPGHTLDRFTTLWKTWIHTQGYLPWRGWSAVLSHGPMLVATVLVAGAFGLFVLVQAGKDRRADWGGPAAAGRGQHGTAHWRSMTDLARGYKAWAAPKTAASRTPMTLIPAGLLVGANSITRPTGGWVLERDEHGLILGSTRSGKSRRIIIPSIYLIGQAAQESLVMTDPKGELYEHTAEWLKEQGYRIVRLDLINPRPGRSQRFNPVQAVRHALEQGDVARAAALAREIGHLITFGSGSLTNSEPIWVNGQISLTAALVLAVAEKAPSGQRHLGSVYSLLLAGGEDEGAGLDDLFREFPHDHPARSAYGTVKLSSSKTRAGILTTTAAGLQIFGDPELVWVTGEADHDMGLIGNDAQPTAVFLVIPHDETSKYMVASLYIAQLFRALTQSARQHHGRLPHRVNFLLDEFGNMPAFPDFDQFVTVSAGMGIRLVLALQNLEQLKKHYRETERTIRGNLGTWCFLRTSDIQTAEELGKIMGQYTTQTESSQMPRVGWMTINTNVGHTSQGQSLTGRDLIKPDEIMRWPENQVLTWQSGFAPARLPLPDLSQWSLFAPVATPRPFDPPTAVFVPPAVWHGLWDGSADDGYPREEVSTMTVAVPEAMPAEDEMMAALFGDQPEPLDWHDHPPDAS